MAAKSRYNKKSGSTRRSVDAGDEDRLIAELNNRIQLLEKEFRSKQEDATSQEITGSKQAEQVRALLASIVMSSEDAIFSKELDGTITSWNLGAGRIYGYAAAEIVGRSVDVIVPPDKLQEFLGILEKIGRGERVEHFETVRVTKDGRRIDVSITISPIADAAGNVIGASTIARDITERKQADEDKKRLIYDLGERVKELTALHRVYDIIQKGVSVPEVLQEVTNILPPAWQYPEVTAARIVFDGREFVTSNFLETPWKQRADFHTADGKHGAIEVYYLEKRRDEAEGPFLAEERNLINSLAETMRIYLDKWYAEEALADAKAQAELYLDLMGHDINNMHQIALGYLELARDMRPEAGKGEFLDKPVEVLQRSAQLIRNVRKLQKLRDGLFRTELVDVCRLLADVQREFGAMPHKQVTLNLNGRERCLVRANDLLHDVFANLVSNAIKHTGDRADIVVDLGVVWNDGRQYCRVMVEDDGPGIPDDFKGKIFHRMLKGTTNAKGMGLGLYLVMSLVESYNGRVWVEDRVPGDYMKGARFVVMLPAVEK